MTSRQRQVVRFRAPLHFREHSAPYIDLSGPKEEVSAQLESVMSDEIIIGDDEAFFLHPGMLALATTLESVKLPPILSVG